MNSILRKVLRPFKPIAKKIFPGYFRYDTVNYWVNREGPSYYDNYSVNFDGTTQAALQEKYLIEEMKKIEFSSILEYGCGYGRILNLVEKEFPGRKIEGCDISPHQLKNAEKILGVNSRCNLFIFDGKKTPREDSSFDVVYICNVLQHQTHHIINDVRNEIFRLSRKYILLMEPNHSKEEEEADRIEGSLPDKTCYKHNNSGYFESRGCRILKNKWIPEIGNFIIVIEKP